MNFATATPNTTTAALRWQWLVAITCYLIGVPAGLLGLGVVLLSSFLALCVGSTYGWSNSPAWRDIFVDPLAIQLPAFGTILIVLSSVLGVLARCARRGPASQLIFLLPLAVACGAGAALLFRDMLRAFSGSLGSGAGARE
jgi:hypothetical protein